jgi:hypothetical protein
LAAKLKRVTGVFSVRVGMTLSQYHERPIHPVRSSCRLELQYPGAHSVASVAGSACGIRDAQHVENPHLSASHNACNEKAQEKEPDLLAKGKFAALKFVELEG